MLCIFEFRILLETYRKVKNIPKMLYSALILIFSFFLTADCICLPFLFAIFFVFYWLQQRIGANFQLTGIPHSMFLKRILKIFLQYKLTLIIYVLRNAAWRICLFNRDHQYCNLAAYCVFLHQQDSKISGQSGAWL